MKILDDKELELIRDKKMHELKQQIIRAEEPKKKKSVLLTVQEEQFELMMREHPNLVVDFWAEWCGPCKMVSPIIEELAEEFSGRVTFAKCNTDENKRLSASMGITAIPTIIMFSKGVVRNRAVGAFPKDVIRSKVKWSFGI